MTSSGPTWRPASPTSTRPDPKGTTVKYLVLIHSKPQPWGHPTADFIEEYQQLDAETRERQAAEFDAVLAELSAKGQLLAAEALGDPADAKLVRVRDGEQVVTDGPYSETAEHLAGFFLIDVEDAAAAEAVATKFGCPGETIELRPIWG